MLKLIYKLDLVLFQPSNLCIADKTPSSDCNTCSFRFFPCISDKLPAGHLGWDWKPTTLWAMIDDDNWKQKLTKSNCTLNMVQNQQGLRHFVQHHFWSRCFCTVTILTKVLLVQVSYHLKTANRAKARSKHIWHLAMDLRTILKNTPFMVYNSVYGIAQKCGKITRIWTFPDHTNCSWNLNLKTIRNVSTNHISSINYRTATGILDWHRAVKR